MLHDQLDVTEDLLPPLVGRGSRKRTDVYTDLSLALPVLFVQKLDHRLIKIPAYLGQRTECPLLPHNHREFFEGQVGVRSVSHHG